MKPSDSDKYTIDSLINLFEPYVVTLHKKSIKEYPYEVYRFWYSPTLINNPFVLQFELELTQPLLRFEEYSFKGDSIIILDYWEKLLSKQEIKYFYHLIEKYDYWEAEIIIQREVADGYVFYIEASNLDCDEPLYRVAFRNTPYKNDKIGELFRLIRDWSIKIK